MNRKLAGDLLLPLFVLIMCTALIAAGGWDLKVASWWYSPQDGWPYADRQPWLFLYKAGPAIVLTGGIAAALAGLAAFRRTDGRRIKKMALFLVLLLALGPGLLVNTVLKDHWGRPRPRQVLEFGGKQPFHQVWERGTAGKGKSFPSGHASGAFFFIGPYFLLRRSSRRRAYAFLLGGSAFGFLMGIARIAQGGHFLSDILWAGGIVYLVATGLAHLLRLEEDQGEQQANLHSGNAVRLP